MREAKATGKPEYLTPNMARPVNAGIRALNFTIDLFVWLLLAVIAIILLDYLLPTVSHFTINALAYSAMVLLFLGYYSVLEYRFQKILGKWITRTKVVSLTGDKLTAGAVFRRSFARLLPIDWASYLFTRNGMHDALSGSRVVKDRKA
ncbi:RDD family protein [Pontibacter actiniarum]|uniref:RDD family protein n=1 Tax=Pontibacter actiniarum TaxID=323450 RepID=A0A1X9YVD1_9BACT|nr:RDD family protein [Pontibacter actiniarum]ARS36724.1 RDD family protein [Pontibacter actiniarum]